MIFLFTSFFDFLRMKTHAYLKYLLTLSLGTLLMSPTLDAAISAQSITFSPSSTTDGYGFGYYINEIEIYSSGMNVASSAYRVVPEDEEPGGEAGQRYPADELDKLVDGDVTNYIQFQSSDSLDFSFDGELNIDKIRVISSAYGQSLDGLVVRIGEINRTLSGDSGIFTWDLTAPDPQVLSAAMRDGTTIMDITFRVDDLDDATVKVRALAFVDGVRSFANVLRPSSFVEGTAANLGDNIATGVDHTLAWDVGADWDVALGQIKFEILCQDDRGLLPFEWVTIPSAGNQPRLKISRFPTIDSDVFDALLWQYAGGDPGLALQDGVLSGSAASGVFAGVELFEGGLADAYDSYYYDPYGHVAPSYEYAAPYIFKQMELDPAATSEVDYARSARANLQSYTEDESDTSWHAIDRAYSGLTPIVHWGDRPSVPVGLNDVSAIALSLGAALVLQSDGTVYVTNNSDWSSVPSDLTSVTAIAAGGDHSLALKADGTVVAWGRDYNEQVTVPAGLANVIAIAAGDDHSLALKDDGTVVAWGADYREQATVPAGLTNVIAIAAGSYHSLALKEDGSVVAWGGEDFEGLHAGRVPAGLTGITGIAAGANYSVAFKAKAE